MTRRRTILLIGSAALLVTASRFLCRGRVPDDYDSVGFVLALDDFDLGKLQPHFPGYPVYVALGRVAHLIVRSPLVAAQLVSAFASGATAAGLWVIGRKLGGERAAWGALAMYGACWLPWFLGGAALSDATAAAFAVLGFASLAVDRRATSGFCVALMLGTRASYWPIALSWLILSRSRRALVGFAAGLLAWFVPFALAVGPANLATLARTHLTGHFTDWGGSIVTKPDLTVRSFCFARDLLYDGIAPRQVCVIGILALLVFVIRKPTRDQLITAAVLMIPYAAWALLAQNIIEQPRHLLPLVLAVATVSACMLAKRPGLLVAAVALALGASLPLALARPNTLPAAAQAAQSPTGTDGLVVFGTRSMRMFNWLVPTMATRTRSHLAEVDVDLERFDRLPKKILVTSEVEGDRVRSLRLREVATFCRDVRFDRQTPCLTLHEYRLGAAP
jgi:hypothetical protein